MDSIVAARRMIYFYCQERYYASLIINELLLRHSCISNTASIGKMQDVRKLPSLVIVSVKMKQVDIVVLLTYEYVFVHLYDMIRNCEESDGDD